jgi:hypothetical protein
MRHGEILALTWDKVDLKAGFIRMKDTDTITDAARSILIGRELRDVLWSLPVALDGSRVPFVFSHNGQRVKSIKRAFRQMRPEQALPIVSFTISAMHTIGWTGTQGTLQAIEK